MKKQIFKKLGLGRPGKNRVSTASGSNNSTNPPDKKLEFLRVVV